MKIDRKALSVHTLFPEGANLLVKMLPQEGGALTESVGKKANNGVQVDRPALKFAKRKNDARSLSFVTAWIPYRGSRVPETELKRIAGDLVELRVGSKSWRLRYQPENNLLKLEP